MENNQIAVHKKELTFQERFTSKVMTLFSGSTGQDVALTEFQKRLAQNYCIELDGVLKKAEQGRLKKSEKYRDAVPVTWANIDMNGLANAVVSAARVGLDPMQKNHVNLIPFKDNATGKYNITFIEGYRGIELKATKYGLDTPNAVVVELIYSNDKFKEIKKDRNNKFNDYEFEITEPFDRGEIKGGFYYHIYNDNPSKNKLVVFSMKDIEKRKPAKASAEFWGGEKDVWTNGKKTGTEHIEGWKEEMCWKTIYRAAYGDITIDSQKIDDDYLRLKKLESQAIESIVENEIEENANKEFVDIDATQADVIDEIEEDNSKNTEPGQIDIEESPGY